MNKELLRYIVSAKFALIVLMFTMPFVTVSCGGDVRSFSGMDMAFGPGENRDGMWQMLAVLLVAVAGALGFFWKETLVHYLQAAFGAMGVILMAFAKNQLDHEAAKEGLSLQYDFAFVFSWVLFLLAMAGSMYALRLSGRRPLPAHKDIADISQAGQEAIHRLSAGVMRAASQAQQHFAQANARAGKTAYNPAYGMVLRATDPAYPDIPMRPGDKLIVGRSSGSSVRLNNTFVSNRHCELVLDADGGVVVRDLGSTNGTYIDGHKLTPNQPHPLSSGQRLIVGSEDVVYTA
jgi:hypothetical protein